jgi:hypothetical protein
VKNLMAGHDRHVSVARLDAPLTNDGLRRYFVGKDAYRRTQFIVAKGGDGVVLLRIAKASEQELFSPIVDVDIVARQDECVFVHAPEVDTAIPMQLAQAARTLAPDSRCVVVQGLYEHVNFICDLAPVPIRVVEVDPPRPAKLIDQVRRVLQIAEELPPIDVHPEVADLVKLASSQPARRYLFPCRGSGAAPFGSEVAYLDEHPQQAEWVLVGCTRSRQIHTAFYGTEPSYVDMCPRRLTGDAGAPTLTKCCLLEEGVETSGLVVTVPWGATLDEVRVGLHELLKAAGEAWAPG